MGKNTPKVFGWRNSCEVGKSLSNPSQLGSKCQNITKPCSMRTAQQAEAVSGWNWSLWLSINTFSILLGQITPFGKPTIETDIMMEICTPPYDGKAWKSPKDSIGNTPISSNLGFLKCVWYASSTGGTVSLLMAPRVSQGCRDVLCSWPFSSTEWDHVFRCFSKPILPWAPKFHMEPEKRLDACKRNLLLQGCKSPQMLINDVVWCSLKQRHLATSLGPKYKHWNKDP